MALHQVGLHHAEKRHKQGQAQFFDRLMIAVGIIGPLSLLPQVIKIWVHGDADGVSALSWTLLAAGSCMWIVYGVFHKAKAIIISNILGAVLSIVIVVGVLMSR